jgi:hypothetical protein
MWTIAAAVGAGLFLVWYALLRPRRGGKHAPPLVTDCGGGSWVPLIGHLLEFFRSPNSMIRRCSTEVGPVFTIPVRVLRRVYVEIGFWH